MGFVLLIAFGVSMILVCFKTVKEELKTAVLCNWLIKTLGNKDRVFCEDGTSCIYFMVYVKPAVIMKQERNKNDVNSSKLAFVV